MVKFGRHVLPCIGKFIVIFIKGSLNCRCLNRSTLAIKGNSVLICIWRNLKCEC